MNNKYYIAAAVLAVSAAAVIGASSVSAQNTDGRPSMIKSLAEKLGIDESKVQTAMNAVHSERQAEMLKQFEARLTQAVKDGKITEAQKQLILKKHEELQKSREALKTMTPEQRRAQLTTWRTELEKWATDNKIDVSVFFGKFGMQGKMHGFGRMH